jgi:hypothetical protein
MPENAPNEPSDTAGDEWGVPLDPYGGPDEPDPDFAPARNSRFHGNCGTCGGNGSISLLVAEDPWTVEEVTCFACGGLGSAEAEKLCVSCRGERWLEDESGTLTDCPDCGGSGYSVECPYDRPENYYWSDPWTRKE